MYCSMQIDLRPDMLFGELRPLKRFVCWRSAGIGLMVHTIGSGVGRCQKVGGGVGGGGGTQTRNLCTFGKEPI